MTSPPARAPDGRVDFRPDERRKFRSGWRDPLGRRPSATLSSTPGQRPDAGRGGAFRAEAARLPAVGRPRSPVVEAGAGDAGAVGGDERAFGQRGTEIAGDGVAHHRPRIVPGRQGGSSQFVEAELLRATDLDHTVEWRSTSPWIHRRSRGRESLRCTGRPRLPFVTGWPCPGAGQFGLEGGEAA